MSLNNINKKVKGLKLVAEAKIGRIVFKLFEYSMI